MPVKDFALKLCLGLLFIWLPDVNLYKYLKKQLKLLSIVCQGTEERHTGIATDKLMWTNGQVYERQFLTKWCDENQLG